MKVRIIDRKNDRTHRRRDVVLVKYHRTTSNGWEKVETFAAARKDTHLSKLEKLEKRLEKDHQRRERQLEKGRKVHTEAKERTAQARSASSDGSGRARKPAAAHA